MRFVDPKNYAAFKKIFGNEEKKEIVISFLNAVLGLEGEKQINAIESINPHYLKPSLLDVKAKDKRAATLIIRIVKARLAENKRRIQYYAAKAYLSQIQHEANNPVLNPVFLIALLEHDIFDPSDSDNENAAIAELTGLSVEEVTSFT